MISPPSANRSPLRRGGATVVEVALLMSIFLMFMFGILEYSRYLMAVHVATNAARDGARYASVNVDKPSNFDYVDFTSGSRTYPSVWKYTVQRMGGTDKMIKNLTVATFPCDNNFLYNTTSPYVPTVQAKSGYVAPTAAQYASGANITRTTQWNGASFTERIAVRVAGTYDAILPNFLFLSGTKNFSITMLSGSEG